MGKSKNISIRFDEEKTAFALLEEKIEKHQKLVDFLLEKYWWEKKMGVNPISDRNNAFQNAARGRDEDGANRYKLRFAKNQHKKAKGKVIKSAIEYTPTTHESFDGEKVNRAILDEIGVYPAIDPNFPVKTDKETSFEYRIRCAEYNEAKNKTN